MADDDLSLWASISLGEPDLVESGPGGAANVPVPSDAVLAACAFRMTPRPSPASGRVEFTRLLLDGSARLTDAPDGEDVAVLRAGFEALHMAADLAGLGVAPTAAWIREVAAVLGGVADPDAPAAAPTDPRSHGEGDPHSGGNADAGAATASEGSEALARDFASDRFGALPPAARAGFALHATSRASIPGDDGRLGAVIASVFLIRHGGTPLFLPGDASTVSGAAMAEASDGRPSAVLELIGQGRAELDRLMAGGELGDRPAADAEPVPADTADGAVSPGVQAAAEAEPVEQSTPEGNLAGSVAIETPQAAPAPASEPAAAPEPAPASEPAAPAADEGDTLPADLDISNYVGQYTFPDIHRRRIPGYIYLAVATVCFALWVTTRGDDPVLVNSGFAVAAFGFLLVGWYHVATAWPLDVRDTDALVAAARVVGFPVGHASAQLGWRGLRSRPTWRILLYSSEEPPVNRGLVLVDGTDGTVLSHFTESNPEDWSKYDD